MPGFHGPIQAQRKKDDGRREICFDLCGTLTAFVCHEIVMVEVQLLAAL